MSSDIREKPEQITQSPRPYNPIYEEHTYGDNARHRFVNQRDRPRVSFYHNRGIISKPLGRSGTSTSLTKPDPLQQTRPQTNTRQAEGTNRIGFLHRILTFYTNGT